MRITAENTLFTEVSFPRSNTYALKFGYIEVTTKQQTLHLVQRTLDTLKEYSDYIPNIKELYEERHDDFFEQTLKAKICNLEDAFVVEEKPLGAYLGIVRALTELRIALCPGDLVNDFTTYATTEEFQHCSSTLLNQSLHSLIKDPWRLQ